MKRSHHLVLCAALAAAFVPQLADAAVTGTTGAVTSIAVPSNVSDGVLESNTQVFLFPEQQNVTLNNAITADVSVPGTTPASPTNDNFSVASISAGTRVNSYFLHFDAVGSPSMPVELTGSVTFDSDVLGLIFTSANLNATSSSPGLSTTAYSTNGGLEINSTPAFDSITLSPDRHTVTIDLRDANSPDDVRIITAAVPEPASLSLLCIGTLALLARRGRT